MKKHLADENLQFEIRHDPKNVIDLDAKTEESSEPYKSENENDTQEKGIQQNNMVHSDKQKVNTKDIKTIKVIDEEDFNIYYFNIYDQIEKEYEKVESLDDLNAVQVK